MLQSLDLVVFSVVMMWVALSMKLNFSASSLSWAFPESYAFVSLFLAIGLVDGLHYGCISVFCTHHGHHIRDIVKI